MEPDDLYGLPPAEFVPARDALAKELRAAGDRERAKEVKALPKPSRAAGVVNRLVREHPDEAGAVREAARCLEEAQDEVLAGGDPGALREAADAARAAIERLAAHVEEESAGVREAVRASLHAATVDTEARDEVLGGKLLKERAAAGFGGLEVALAAAAKGGAKRGGSSRARGRDAGAARRGGDADGGASAPTREDAAERRRREAERHEQRRAAEEREARKRRDALRRAKEAEAEAQAAVEAAQRGVEQVERTLAARKADLRDARKALTEARRRRQRAEA